MALKLFAESDYRLWKIQVAAEYAGIDVDVVSTSSPDFKKTAQAGKAPLLVTPTGSIFESNAILRYVGRLRPETGLYGTSFHEAALVDQWIDFSATELEPVRHIWLLPVTGQLQFNGKAYVEAKKEVGDALAILNNHLLHHTYLAGEQITLADIAIAATLVEPYRELFEPNFRKGFENVTRWFTTVVNQKPFLTAVGKVEFAKQEKRAAKPAKPEGEKKPQQQQQQQQQQPKQPKQQQPQQKKEEQKPAAAAEEPLGDEDAPKPKAKNPLDLLPASNMNLDTVKKLLFSQKPWNPNFFKDFWPMFDASGYSIYFADYNYNNENRVYFMTCNLLGGYLQRCDDVRRYALGVMILAGQNEEEPPFEVSAVWVFRGPEVPQGMKDNPDSEYYTWTKLDTNNKEHRDKIEEWFFADKVKSKTGSLNVLERRWFK